MRSLILLIFFTCWTEAVSADIVDDCDYSASPTPQSRCGDTCIAANKRCICGGETLNTLNGPNHCCVDEAPEQCYIDSSGQANCPEGKVLNKTETCNDHCFNDYTASEKIGRDSHFHCGNACVPVIKMCRGYSLCKERFNDSACQSSPLNLFFQNETLTLKEKIDFSSIVSPCLNYDRNPGLRCGENCVRNSLWCRGDYSLSCEGQFTTNNQELCGNATVWINQTCDQFYDTGDKAALGFRCQGGAQHCYYPWYVSGNYYYESNKKRFPGTCEDFSDRVFTLNQRCNEEKYVEIYNETVCSGEVFNGQEDQRYCEDLKAIILENNSTDYWDPHNCRESCSEPGYGCLACTNPDFFHCTRNNTEVCIHPELVCNQHPDCDNAVDENLDMCYDKYIAQGKIDESATLRCHSKIYKDMETFASVCNGVAECQGDKDESPDVCGNEN